MLVVVGWGRLSPSLRMRAYPSHKRIHGAWKMMGSLFWDQVFQWDPQCVPFREGGLQKLPFQAWESWLKLGITGQGFKSVRDCSTSQAPGAAHSGLQCLKPTNLQSLPGSRLPENISQLVCTNNFWIWPPNQTSWRQGWLLVWQKI